MILQQYHGIKKTVKEVVHILAQLYNIQLDEESGDDTDSPFQRARGILLDKDALSLPKTQPSLISPKVMTGLLNPIFRWRIESATSPTWIWSFRRI